MILSVLIDISDAIIKRHLLTTLNDWRKENLLNLDLVLGGSLELLGTVGGEDGACGELVVGVGNLGARGESLFVVLLMT